MGDRLGLLELPKRVPAPFPANTALAVTAERGLDVEPLGAVDRDGAGTQRPGDGHGSFLVAEHGRGQAVDGAVGDADGVVVVVVADHDLGGPEDLLLGDPGAGVDVRDKGGLDVVAAVELVGAATAENDPPLLAGEVVIAQDPVALPGADHWSHDVDGVGGVPVRDGRHGGLGDGDGLVHAAAGYQQAGEQCAALAGVRAGHADGPGYRGGEVGVVEQDGGGLAT